MKGWVSSAFENVDMLANASNTKKQNATLKTKFKSHKSDEPLQPVCNQQKSSVKSSQKISDGILLAEKYEPKTRSELMVNKSKIDELSSYIDTLYFKLSPTIFILNGPPGK